MSSNTSTRPGQEDPGSECTFELAWKTLKDDLVYGGVAFDQITPPSVIEQVFTWLKARAQE